MLYIILALFLALFIFSAYIFFNINKLKDINGSINVCANNINAFLNKKLNIIKTILNKINDAKLSSKFAYSDNYNLYEKEKSLFDITFNINKYLKNKKSIDLNNEIKELNTLEENIDGLKDFYNANVLNYNEVFLKKYLNKIYRLFKFNDYKAFKVRKLEEYEIFKN